MLQEELRRSRETLEQKLALPVRAISIPYGRCTIRILQACASTGYERVYTSDPWIGSKSRAGVHVHGRLSVRSTLKPVELRRLLTLKTFPHRCLRTKSRGKEAVKLVLGERLYSGTWLGRIRKVLGVFAAIDVLSKTFYWESLNLFLGP